jgi:DNA-binding transcriptional MerR regulator
MRIGDAAAAAGTTPRALRLYEQRGLLPPPTRTPTGQRQYSPADVTRIRLIRELLSVGLTIGDIHSCVDHLHRIEADPTRPCGGAQATPGPGIAARRLAALDDEIARLTRLRDQLAARVRAGAAPSRTPSSSHQAETPSSRRSA